MEARKQRKRFNRRPLCPINHKTLPARLRTQWPSVKKLRLRSMHLLSSLRSERWTTFQMKWFRIHSMCRRTEIKSSKQKNRLASLALSSSSAMIDSFCSRLWTMVKWAFSQGLCQSTLCIWRKILTLWWPEFMVFLLWGWKDWPQYISCWCLTRLSAAK